MVEAPQRTLLCPGAAASPARPQVGRIDNAGEGGDGAAPPLRLQAGHWRAPGGTILYACLKILQIARLFLAYADLLAEIHYCVYNEEDARPDTGPDTKAPPLAEATFN